MQLRGKLLSYFIALILLVLVVFGLIAYQITNSASLQKEKRLLQLNTQERADILAHIFKQQAMPASLQIYLNITHTQDTLYILLDSNDNILNLQAVPESWRARLKHIPFTEQNQGQAIYHEDLYLWSRAFISGSPYALLQLYHSNHAEDPFVSLAPRMLVSGLIIVWIAVWVALIISTVVARRLQAQTDALTYQSQHDALTQLPNRLLLHEKLTQAIITATETHNQLALIVMDLDHFKEINDTLGHDIGDHLLQEIAERIKRSLAATDLLARMGGDEFAVLLKETTAEHIKQVITVLLDAIQQAFTIKGLVLEMETSLGIAIFPQHGEDAKTLMQHADIAMYLAKNKGKAFAFYDREQDPHSVKRLTLMADLRHAIESGELQLHYQPKVDIKSGNLLSVEALTRWRHPLYGFIQPEVFIALAEQTGIIKALTYWTLKTGIRQCALWQKAGRHITLAINLSPRMLHDLQLPSEISAILKLHDLAAECLELEITETAIMQEPEHALDILTHLHDMGAKLAIDDFGTGYTSLAYLKQLPIDEIKIDMSFIRGMLHDKNDAMIVRSIIELAHNMGYKVVAEGVESDKIYRHLMEEDCDIAQGEFISRPLSAAKFENWLSPKPWKIPRCIQPPPQPAKPTLVAVRPKVPPTDQATEE